MSILQNLHSSDVASSTAGTYPALARTSENGLLIIIITVKSFQRCTWWDVGR